MGTRCRLTPPHIHTIRFRSAQAGRVSIEQNHTADGGKEGIDGPVSGSRWQVVCAFAKLSLTSFGGPIAHLGYYREAFVVRRKWLDEASYADIVALGQFLPGPASSQVCFTIGLLRAGLAGGLLAWLTFTLPSAIILTGFAFAAGSLEGPLAVTLLHTLKIVAVSIVAQAVWGMARSLCPDRERATIAVVAALMALGVSGALGQILAIVLGGAAGLIFCRAHALAPSQKPLNFAVSLRTGRIALAVFFTLLLLLPLAAIAFPVSEIALFDAFYRAGSLVFGGGHVVLPLLQTQLVQPGWVQEDAFFAGYGAAQAIPGPVFTFAAYLGAVAQPVENALAAAALCLIAIFLPGLLLVVGALPYWNALRGKPRARALMSGTNAAVVGLLGAVLYTPLWTSTVVSMQDFALALIGFFLLSIWAAPSWLVVGLMLALGAGLAHW